MCSHKKISVVSTSSQRPVFSTTHRTQYTNSDLEAGGSSNTVFICKSQWLSRQVLCEERQWYEGVQAQKNKVMNQNVENPGREPDEGKPDENQGKASEQGSKVI